MECEYGADVASWAKKSPKIPSTHTPFSYFLLQELSFTTGTIKYSTIQCEISVTSLRKTLHGETNIFKILNLKSRYLNFKTPSGITESL
jgi:hypothetical protein